MTGMSGFPEVTPPSESDAFQVLFRTRQAGVSAPKRMRPGREAEPVDGRDREEESVPITGKQNMERSKVRPGSYEAMGLGAELCKALQAAGYGFPTPIQRKVIPHVLAGDDVVAMARTGSGKTAAFLAPLLHRLNVSPLLMSTSSRQNGPRALVVAPTRELILQTYKFCRIYSKFLSPALRTAVVVGGTPLEAQFEALAVCPDIIFATPGRLLQILTEMGAKGGLTVATAEIVVFDEADRLFEGTLAVETAALIENLRNKQTEAIEGRQTILVSATMPHALAEFSKTGLRKSLSVVRLDADKGISPTLATAFLTTRGDVEKDAALQTVVRRTFEKDRSIVVFAGTHRRVEYLTELLRTCITPHIVCIHGNLDQMARLDAVSKFKKGIAKLLVVTDVAARGIDLPELDVVINYDMPATPKLFVHRIGRVGRAGRFGLAFSLVTPDEVPYMLDVFLFVGRGVILSKADSLTSPLDPFESHAVAIESSFVVGALPKTAVDEEVELTKHALRSVDLNKAYKSARNAHGLYTKTRGVASGESVRRGKELFTNSNGSRLNVHVHPWFADMETSTERLAAEEASRLSVWRPKECLVTAPNSVLRRKRSREDRTMQDKGMEALSFDAQAQAEGQSSILSKAQLVSSSVSRENAIGKKSARVAALEEERKQFFLPTQQDNTRIQAEKALRVKSGGAMADGLNAYRELTDAVMDLNADGNTDLLRSKHIGSSTVKYWDRVSKKFVKGGVTSATSKRNLHVASREAKARANSGEAYGSADGVLFKKWLRKNRQAVEQLAESVEEGNAPDLRRHGLGNGLGSNDFRKGAFGRRARIAAAARNKEHNGGGSGMDSRKSELKSREEIKKSRKLKMKAEARRKAHAAKKTKRSRGKDQIGGAADRRSSSKSRLIIRKK